eukprot:365213-Chlamydomonas_euryale.AAC.5
MSAPDPFCAALHGDRGGLLLVRDTLQASGVFVMQALLRRALQMGEQVGCAWAANIAASCGPLPLHGGMPCHAMPCQQTSPPPLLTLPIPLTPPRIDHAGTMLTACLNSNQATQHVRPCHRGCFRSVHATDSVAQPSQQSHPSASWKLGRKTRKTRTAATSTDS